MAKEYAVALPLNVPQWRIYIIPDYSETESVFVLKVNHAISDGVGFMCFLNDITDNPTVEGYPNVMLGLTRLQKMMIGLLAPLYSQWLTIKVLLAGPEKISFKQIKEGQKFAALKDVRILPDLSLEQVKRCVK
mmetsp:Transcript_20846/g.25559  ORF Transcript_20846/g.25559 Transcript_20846/m.25559 type:complete len:133 (-) Transcript_20846:662-1060(-)